MSDNIFTYASHIRSSLIRYIVGDSLKLNEIAMRVTQYTGLNSISESNQIKLNNTKHIKIDEIEAGIKNAMLEFFQINKKYILESLMLIGGNANEHYTKLLEYPEWIYDIINANDYVIIIF